MSDVYLEECDPVYIMKVLSHPIRRQILRHLSGSIQIQYWLEIKMGMPQSSLAHHIKLLHNIGAVFKIRDGADSRAVRIGIRKRRLKECIQAVNDFLMGIVEL